MNMTHRNDVPVTAVYEHSVWLHNRQPTGMSVCRNEKLYCVAIEHEPTYVEYQYYIETLPVLAEYRLVYKCPVCGCINGDVVVSEEDYNAVQKGRMSGRGHRHIITQDEQCFDCVD